MQSYLFIGVGGSGGKTLAYLWRALDRRLTAAGWDEGMPPIWQFLHIDPKAQNDALGGDIPVVPAGSIRYLNLADPPKQYSAFDEQLMLGTALPGVAGWRPEPPGSIPPPYEGAGQRRAVGRAVGIVEMARIQTAIRAQIGPMTDGASEEYRERLRRLFRGENAAGDDFPSHAVVIGSLAGGSGSGLFLDVNFTVRAEAGRGKWSPDDPLTILYTSELFENLPDGLRRGIAPNSLGAISELMAANEGCLDARTLSLFETIGNAPQEGAKRTGRVTAIVGMRNENVSMRSEKDVYRSVGNLLAGTATDPALRQDFGTFICNTNGANYSENFRLSKFTGTGSSQAPLSTMGYASYGLGRNLFAQYAAERLARVMRDRMLGGHRRIQPAGEQWSEERLISRAADAREAEFFDATGLHERGRDHNQVLDALRDRTTLKDLLDAAVERARAAVQTNVKAALSAQNLQVEVGNGFANEQKKVVEVAQTKRHERAQAWSSSIGPRLVDAVAREIAVFGFPTTLTLIDRLSAQMNDAIEELEKDRGTSLGEARSLVAAAQAVFVQLSEKVTGNHKSVNDSLAKRRNGLAFELEADVYSYAASLMVDVRDNLLRPLRATVEAASASLQVLSNEPGADRDKFDQWSAGAMPKHLLPAPNEYLLEGAETFPSAFEALLGRMFDDDPGNAEGRAVIETVTGIWPVPTEPDHRTPLLTVKSRWVPQHGSARPAGAASESIAEYVWQLNADTLLARAREWVWNRSDISAYVHESLAEYLATNGPERVARGNAFATAFGAAVGAAKPLVGINEDTNGLVHNDGEDLVYTFGRIPVEAQIPVAAGTLFEKVVQAMQNRGVAQFDTPERIADLCDPSVTGGDADIVTFSTKGRHPVVYSSLFEPIAEAWIAMRNAGAGAMNQFWDNRRAAVLPDFVPLGYPLQEAIIRGFVLAHVLGLLQDRGLSGRPVSLWTDQGVVSFPWPYLGGPVGKSEELHRLLESYVLALVDLSQGNQGTMLAYEALIDLGGNGTGGFEISEGGEPDGVLNPALISWIRDGRGPDGGPQPLSDTAGPSAAEGGAPVARLEAVRATYETVLKGYAEIADPRINRVQGNRLELDRRWEIKPLVQSAIAPIMAAFDKLQVGPITNENQV